jgi:hypothetical protein
MEEYLMRRAFMTGVSTAVFGAFAAGAAFAQAGADYEVDCTQALAEQEGVEQTAIGIGPAEQVEGTMQLNLTLEGVDWICKLDENGDVASLEQAQN